MGRFNLLAKFHDMSLRKKLTLAFAATLCVPITALGIFSFTTAAQDMQKQVVGSMEANLAQIVTDLNGRFERENDFTKFIAYNMELRELLQKRSQQPVELARGMNERWEPTFWYFLTSDVNLKGARIYTPSVKSKIGSFLYPASEVEDQEWYRYQQKNFGTSWWAEDGNIYATRTVLGASEDMRNSVGVIRAEIYTDRLLEPVLSESYLSNGFLLTDGAGKAVVSRSVADSGVDAKVRSAVSSGAQALSERQFVLISREIPLVGWRLYYYVDMAETAGRLSHILLSTLLAVGVCLVLSFFLIRWLARTLSVRILQLKDIAMEIENGNLTQEIHSETRDEIGLLTNSMGNMSRRLNDLVNRVYKVELEKRAAELKALQAMINPHFLYNCLSNIKWKALESGADEISEITGLVARFYRTSLNNGNMITTVGNEIENIQAYIQIQLLTHEEQFDVEYHIEDSCLELSMLNFLLQPIVENAVKHGIEHKLDGGRGLLILEAGCGSGELLFRIMNNGPSIEEQSFQELLRRQTGGYGIRNIQERIALYYGKDCGLSAGVTDQGYTCFTVRLKTEVRKELLPGSEN